MEQMATNANAILVGGIYSVIKSKAPVTTAEYGDRYTLIGPLNRSSVSHDNTGVLKSGP